MLGNIICYSYSYKSVVYQYRILRRKYQLLTVGKRPNNNILTATNKTHKCCERILLHGVLLVCVLAWRVFVLSATVPRFRHTKH